MITIERDVLTAELGIEGLRFAENSAVALDVDPGWFDLKVRSSPGPLVSDFVTHGPEFAYSTSGIHIGQDDRLTFFGDPDRIIDGYFTDCRAGSPTLHKHVHARFHASAFRRLIIERGIAHTFDGLAGIVTRDEPVWYSSENNPHWNVNNDLVSVLRDAEAPPVVEVNQHRLPDSLHEYMTRLSQAVLGEPRAYSTRFLLRIAGKEQYVMFQENGWNQEGRDLAAILSAVDMPGVQAMRSRYAITGKASWTLVPNTDTGVADVLRLPAQRGGAEAMFVHRRTRKWYSLLTNEGSAVRLETLDLRAGSASFGQRASAQLTCDPRVSYVIEPGIAYRFVTPAELYCRSEHEVFVSDDEPRADLPAFGRDLEIIDPANLSEAQPDIPDLRCPGQVVRQMARFELQQV
jgi:dTDP-4-dehydrorhamnose 3,5-epimerase-like enzyme